MFCLTLSFIIGLTQECKSDGHEHANGNTCGHNNYTDSQISSRRNCFTIQSYNSLSPPVKRDVAAEFSIDKRAEYSKYIEEIRTEVAETLEKRDISEPSDG
ncbi:uncharacterized protein FA14DRAFT_13072 [Meira miltonrushii]|uniref:Uncharacterized protein n=1 Tax=Meira miltonrushii TaxID=1280837 RepID=A0A316VJC3_9BASI|nr:uncharacterized protein FA14DRAFT_13072 [Meira miltonrushii]PWN37324.1 hypothetical protein FA14DRAFT_13072 [Meira miltonrushii]